MFIYKDFCLLFSWRQRGGDALVEGSVIKGVKLGLFLSWCGFEPWWGRFFFPKLIFCQHVLVNLLTSIGKLVQSYRYFTSNLKFLFVKNFCLLFSWRQRGGDALVQGSVMKAVELGLFLSWCGLEPQWGSFFIFPKLIFCNLVSMYKLNCRSLPFTFINAFKIELN